MLILCAILVVIVFLFYRRKKDTELIEKEPSIDNIDALILRKFPTLNGDATSLIERFNSNFEKILWTNISDLHEGCSYD